MGVDAAVVALLRQAGAIVFGKTVSLPFLQDRTGLSWGIDHDGVCGVQAGY